jgi:alpha-galactosidase
MVFRFEGGVDADCWMASERSKSGDLVPDERRFPSGMKDLADKMHDMGLLFGIYESAGYWTCQGLPGSLGSLSAMPLTSGFEEQDAKLFTSYGTSLT